ncbi:hypothetical protein HJFPF1_12273 [Paramyrothecium foliicola]|nr:hypothetical protein HJFPF1_12273 [Paramyrothecium foliicola]
MSLNHFSTPKQKLNKWIRNRLKSSAALNLQLDEMSAICPGSAISGRIVLDVREEQVEAFDFTSTINLIKTNKRSFYKRCKTCDRKYMQLDAQSWLAKPTVFTRGRHEFSFSVQIPADFPPSLNTSILASTYELNAQACFYEVNSARNVPLKISLDRIVSVQPRPLDPILPRYLSHNVSGTGIRTSTYFDPFVSLNRTNRVSITIDGLQSQGQDGQDSEIWRLMKGAWSIEETAKACPQACDRHALRMDSDQGKNLIQTNTTRLCGEEIYDGWKKCEKDGSIEFGFDLCFKRGHKIASHVGYANGLGSLVGFEVAHSLVVELVFVLERFSEDEPEQTIRTGQARISQMPFEIFLSGNCKMEDKLIWESHGSFDDELLSLPSYDKEDFLRT